MFYVSNSPDYILQQILIHYIGKIVLYLRYVQCPIKYCNYEKISRHTNVCYQLKHKKHKQCYI